MNNEEKVFVFLTENSYFVDENEDNKELYTKLTVFEDFIAHRETELPTANKIIVKFHNKLNHCGSDEEQKTLLFDYTVFMNLLKKYLVGGLAKKNDNTGLTINKSHYCRSNFDDCFMGQKFINKYCDDQEKDNLSCEPILLFDDEVCAKQLFEMNEVPVLFFRNNQDTQIMNEDQLGDPTKVYHLEQAIASIGRVFNAAKIIGSKDLFANIVKLRSNLIKLNYKPIPLSYRIFGNIYPPEAFIAWRLEEKLLNFKKYGANLLNAIKKAENDNEGITEEEFDDIKESLLHILQVPSRRFNKQTMGMRMNAKVPTMEQSIYHLDPQTLASNLISAIEEKAAKLGDIPNKNYIALQQMFGRLPTSSPIINQNPAASSTTTTTNVPSVSQDITHEQDIVKIATAAEEAVAKSTELSADDQSKAKIVAVAAATAAKKTSEDEWNIFMQWATGSGSIESEETKKQAALNVVKKVKTAANTAAKQAAGADPEVQAVTDEIAQAATNAAVNILKTKQAKPASARKPSPATVTPTSKAPASSAPTQAQPGQARPRVSARRPITEEEIVKEQGQDPTKFYNLDTTIASIGRLLQASKNLRSEELTKTITKLRAELLRLNNKPIPIKYRLLGNIYPPEAFIVWRLEEKFGLLKQKGTQLLHAVKAAEADEAGITEEEVEDIKITLQNILKIPSRRFTVKTMGSLMARVVDKLENTIYQVSPVYLADDFITTLESAAEKLGDRDNKYYVALQQMFTKVPTSSGFVPPKDLFVRDTSYARKEQPEEDTSTETSYESGGKKINFNDPKQVQAAKDLMARISNTFLGKDPAWLEANSDRLKKSLVDLVRHL